MMTKASAQACGVSTPMRQPRTRAVHLASVARTHASTTKAPASVGLDGIVHVLTCGSVDDGKSTLIGRLLWDIDALPIDQRAAIERSVDAEGIPDFSLAVDGLLAEREQGITIDIAWRYVDAGHRRLVLIDSPGHEQYTRNMASGASHADVALMLVDARQGLKPQTRRHAAILQLVGVRNVVLAVNKMDLVGWDETIFRRIESEFAALASHLGFTDAVAIPLSAKRGHNIVTPSSEMVWYTGPTLVSRLGGVPSRLRTPDQAFRFPVQSVIREGDFRGLAGSVVSGMLERGAMIVDCKSGRRARVARIVTMDGDLEVAGPGQAVVLALDTDIDVARGAVLASPGSEPVGATAFAADLVWLADQALQPGRPLVLHTTSDTQPIASLTVRSRLDLATLEPLAIDSCATNDIVRAEIVVGRVPMLDVFASMPATGAFVIVDALSGATVAGGVVKHFLGSDRSVKRSADIFRLTDQLLKEGVCLGLESGEPEYSRRAAAIVRLLEAAGVPTTLDPAGP